MKIVVTGSIATDHLMHFKGRFAEQLLPDQLHQVSLSFLVDKLVIRRGGVAANMAYGMGVLGEHPTLLGAVGPDFDDYRKWLQEHGVDCESVQVFDHLHTARFNCTTDDDMAQIASFYTGAMAEGRNISLQPTVDRLGGIDLLIVGAHDPEGMLRNTSEATKLGIARAADFSQQIALMDGEQIRTLTDGAAYLLSNDYEKNLLESKSGWSDADVLDHVGIRVTTLGERGVEITGKDIERVYVPIAREVRKVDPTGVGDGFRAGFFAGLSWGLSLERSAQVGSMLATLVIETDGPQEYALDRADFIKRLGEAYGDDAAAEVTTHLS
ncbi:carbohydrate kinase family protein [Fodinicola feengrottensis]|uniref:Carbohydrate kinase family protein n=1 Tax=Fodinicola feengrottensis TaxID=435914 RepID=A0ABP4UEC2_9ACTN|nr:carbohydrate kinase family protein [Fodinicola feengrottensis]